MHHVPGLVIATAATALSGGMTLAGMVLAQTDVNVTGGWGALSLGTALTASVSAVAYFGRAMLTGKLRPQPIDDLLKLLATGNEDLAELVKQGHEREAEYHKLVGNLLDQKTREGE